MLKGLVVAVAAGVLILAGTGQLGELRSEWNSVRGGWLESVLKPKSQAEKQKQAWAEFAKKANSICTDPLEAELNIKAAIPHNRAEYVRVVSAVLERERVKLAALQALEPPNANYDISYSNFLKDRGAALSTLERLRDAVNAKDKRGVVRALRSAVRVSVSINAYVQSAGMPACSV